MISRLIYSKIWTDDFFAELTPIEKLLFFYFLTNEKINILHLYEVPQREIAFDTGLTAEEIENTKNKFQAKGKLYFYKNYVYIANASRYQEYTGDKNEKAKLNLTRQLPKDVLDWYYNILDRGIDTPLIPSKIEIKTEIVNDIETKGEEQAKEKIRLILEEKGLTHKEIGKNGTN